MDTEQIHLFDQNNELVDNFDEEIEKVLISVHGENYYDSDEELVNTNYIPLNKIANDHIQEKGQNKAVKNVVVNKNVAKQKKEKVTIRDFIPLLLFIIMFVIILIFGYYLLNTIDFMSLIN